MGRELVKWMRNAGIAVSNEIVEKREEGINLFLDSKMNEDDILEIVKLYYTGQCTADFFETVVEAFYECDKAFCDDQTEEIRVLAGAIICEIIERGNYGDIVILIEMYAQSYQFLGQDTCVSDISRKINEDLHDKMLDLRENMSFESKKITGLGKDTKFTVDEGEEVIYDGSVIKNLSNVVKKVNELSSYANSLSKAVYEQQAIIHEDSQILWWMLTGYSDDDKARYSEINPLKAAILAGKDLANRINVFPGPSSAKAVLAKALEFAGQQESSSLESYIDSVDDIIIENLLRDYDDEYQTPILLALKKKLENGKGNWMTAFSKEYEMKREKISVVEVAYEMYIECLIM